MISVQDLKFHYNSEQYFTFPDFSCDKGKALLITGQSGKGKTTLLHLLAGILKPDSGKIMVGDTTLSSLSERKLDHFRGKNIGLILQQSHFIASLSVLDNIVMASWLATGNKAVSKAMKLLDELGLHEQKHKRTSQLSIGQQQRVSIARALINEPKLLLADEPTSSLDDENAIVVAGLLEDLSKEYGAALVIVTHDQRLKNRFENQIQLI